MLKHATQANMPLAVLHAVCALSYTVSFVEYQALHGETPLETIMLNVNSTREYAQQVLGISDLLVMPEYGVTGFFEGYESRDAWVPYLIQVDDAYMEENICDCAACHEALRALSCTAAQGIAITVNIAEGVYTPTARYQYNTALVFDKGGSLVARYRKTNLWGEAARFDVPTTCSAATFRLTPTSPLIGLVICADLIYDFPTQTLVRQGVQHIVAPVAWTNEMAQMQVLAYIQGMSRVNNITVVVANHHLNASGAWGSGSGVFEGGVPLSYYYELSSASGVMTTVATGGGQPKGAGTGNVQNMHGGYQLIDVNPQAGESTQHCAWGVCCTLTLHRGMGQGYVLAALNGDDDGGGIQWGASVCGVWYKGADPTSYASPHGEGLQHITLSMYTLAKPSILVPEVTLTAREAGDTQQLTNDYDLVQHEHSTVLDLDTHQLITSALIYGRDFSRDQLPYNCT